MPLKRFITVRLYRDYKFGDYIRILAEALVLLMVIRYSVLELISMFRNGTHTGHRACQVPGPAPSTHTARVPRRVWCARVATHRRAPSLGEAGQHRAHPQPVPVLRVHRLPRVVRHRAAGRRGSRQQHLRELPHCSGQAENRH